MTKLKTNIVITKAVANTAAQHGRASTGGWEDKTSEI